MDQYPSLEANSHKQLREGATVKFEMKQTFCAWVWGSRIMHIH